MENLKVRNLTDYRSQIAPRGGQRRDDYDGVHARVESRW
jgi:hypothetical protein